MSHTKGPWIFRKQDPVATHSKWFIMASINGQIENKVVCELADNYWAREHNQVSQLSLNDAYLIAAAPDMLAALELVLNDNRLMNAMSRSQVQAIMDAVFKARGEK